MLITAKWMRRFQNKFPSGKVSVDVNELGITLIVTHVIDGAKAIKFGRNYGFSQIRYFRDCDIFLSSFVREFERFEKAKRKELN